MTIRPSIILLISILSANPAAAAEAPGCADAQAMRQSRLYIEQQLASIEDKRKMRSQEEDQALNNIAKAAGWDEEKKIKVQMSLLLKHPSPQLENEVLDTIIKVWELEEKAAATSWEKNPALACSVGLDLVKLSQHLDALHARKSVLTIQKIKETR